jgi:hypothetical protein
MQARRSLRGRKFKHVVIRHQPHLLVCVASLRPPFASAHFENLGRIAPERLGEGVTQIGAIKPDIGEHARVEAGQDSCVTPIPEDTGKPSGQCEKELHGIPPK